MVQYSQLIKSADKSNQICPITMDYASQAGNGLNSCNVALQVDLQPCNITNYTQTSFLCPGLENDPSYDTFHINRPLYKCELCNIILWLKCRDESVHNDLCQELLHLLHTF